MCLNIWEETSYIIIFIKTKYERNLQDEVGDVVCMIEILKMNGLVNDKQIEERVKEKKEKLMKWSMLFSED